jgi:hypothetical protein
MEVVLSKLSSRSCRARLPALRRLSVRVRTGAAPACGG